MYQNKLNRQWNPCKICKWGSDKTTQEEFDKHCNKCNDLASEWEESNEFKQFKIGVAIEQAVKKIEEYQNANRVYPIIIICTPDAKEKFKEINIEEAHNKGLDLIDVVSVHELEAYTRKYFTITTPIFIIEDSIKVRDWIYGNKEIMDNWKVYTCFPNFNHTGYLVNEDFYAKQYKITKKDILNLKLDRRFDQIAFESYPDLGIKLNNYNIIPQEII